MKAASFKPSACWKRNASGRFFSFHGAFDGFSWRSGRKRPFSISIWEKRRAAVPFR